MVAVLSFVKLFRHLLSYSSETIEAIRSGCVDPGKDDHARSEWSVSTCRDMLFPCFYMNYCGLFDEDCIVGQ